MESPERYVRVLASRQEPGEADGGTGYVLSPTLVLTVAHVVESAWEGGREIRVLSDLWPEGRLAKVLWCRGARRLDAALLEVAAEERFPSVLLQLALSPLPSGSAWTSKGFPRGGSERVPLAGLKGEVLAWPPGGEWLELGADYPPDDAEDWSGISGAAVFVEGLLAGVIGETTRAFPTRLQVISIPTLLREAELAGHLGLTAAELRCRRLITEAEELLGADRVAAEALADAGPARGAADWPSRLTSGGVRALLQRVLQTELVPAVLAANAAHRKLVTPRRAGVPPSEADLASAATLKEVSLRLFPLLHERSRTFALEGAAGTVLPLPLRRETLIEFALAGYYDRPALFGPPPRAGDHPKALASLGEPSFDSSISDGTELFRRFAEDLASAHADTKVQQPLADAKTFREDLVLAHSDEDAFKLSRTGQALRGLNRAFAFKASGDDQPLQYYLLLDRLDPGRDGKELIELLGRHLPAIRVYQPQGDLDVDDAAALPFKSLFDRR